MPKILVRSKRILLNSQQRADKPHLVEVFLDIRVTRLGK